MLISKARVLFTVFLLLVLTACGGGGGSPGPVDNDDSKQNSPVLSSVSAFFTKAPVDGATCHLYDVNDQILAGPVTSSAGAISFTAVSYSGDVYTQCAGGSYVDEATGDSVQLTAQHTMRSVTSSLSSGSNVNQIVTPLTELTHRLARQAGDISSASMARYAVNVADEFGLDDIDITQVRPSELVSISGNSSDSDRYGIALAAVSQMQEDANTAQTASSGEKLVGLIDTFETQISTSGFNAADYTQSLANLTSNQNTQNNISNVEPISSLVGTLQTISSPPVARAGNDLTVTSGDIVRIVGSGQDSDGTIVSYSWQEVNTNRLSLANANNAELSFTAPVVASDVTYTLRFMVEDDDGLTGLDEVNVTVKKGNAQILGFVDLGTATEGESVVTTAFKVLNKSTGEAVANLEIDTFKLLEDGSLVTKFESFKDLEPVETIPTHYYTVLAVDISESITADELEQVKNAAKALIVDPITGESNLIGGQKVAIYTFDGNITRLIDFSPWKNDLLAAIEGIRSGGPSTNLYGAIVQGMDDWVDSFSLSSISYGTMIVITNGNDNTGVNTVTQAEQAVSHNSLYILPIGKEIDLSLMESIAGSNHVYPVENIDKLEVVFSRVVDEIRNFRDGMYLLHYASPKRGGLHNVDISIEGNSNSESDSRISTTFNADGFSDAIPELVVRVSGSSIQSSGHYLIEPADTITVEAKLRWSNRTPSFDFQFVDLDGTAPVFSEISPTKRSFLVPESFVSGRLQVGEISTNVPMTIKSNEFIRDRDSDGYLDIYDFFPTDDARHAKDALDISTIHIESGFELDGHWQGDSTSHLGDVNGDGFDDFLNIVGTPDNLKYYVIFGGTKETLSNRNLSTLESNSGFLLGEFHPNSGNMGASGVGDINSDGVDDFVLHTNRYSNTQGGGRITHSSRRVIFGRTSGWGEDFDPESLSSDEGFIIQGLSNGDFLGIVGAGDVNGDGVGDLLVTSSNADVNALEDNGAVFLVFGQDSTFKWPSVLDMRTLNGTNGFMFYGSEEKDSVGRVITGDINNDGVNDLIIGAYQASSYTNRFGMRSSTGEVYAIFGGRDSWPSSMNRDWLNGANGFVVKSDTAAENIGKSTLIFDANGDGNDDLVIGVSNTGDYYVLYGSNTAWPEKVDIRSLNVNNGYKLMTQSRIENIGDINGDGVVDLMFGVGSTVSVAFGGGDDWLAKVDTSALNGLNGFTLVNDLYSRNFVAEPGVTGGDINGDGIADMLIGSRPAQRYYAGQPAPLGKTFVIYGCNYVTHLCVK